MNATLLHGATRCNLGWPQTISSMASEMKGFNYYSFHDDRIGIFFTPNNIAIGNSIIFGYFMLLHGHTYKRQNIKTKGNIKHIIWSLRREVHFIFTFNFEIYGILKPVLEQIVILFFGYQ
ncbi:hypothetical protein ACJX0J_034522 [Zea mays]